MSSPASSRAERARGLLLAAALASAAACAESVPERGAPWAFETRPEQAFVLEGTELLRVGADPVKVERMAEFRIAAAPREDGGVTLDALLDRYYLRVQGGAQGESELAISPGGIVSRGEPHGELELGPDAELLTGTTLARALASPIASLAVGARGTRQGSIWHTEEPTLAHARVLDWWALAAPPEESDGRVWTGERQIPELGQYQLGIRMPLHYSREAPRVRGLPEAISATGLISRERLRLRPGFEGALELDLSSEITLGGDGALERAELRLRMRFESSEGERVQSEQQMSIRCAACPREAAAPARIN